jgi:trk system potassium uptake protein TrkA
MRIFIIGAGQVGSTIVESLAKDEEHDLTVIDLDRNRLDELSYRFDVRTVEGDGASRTTLAEQGARGSDLFIACTSRDEINIISGLLARNLCPKAKTIVRTSNVEYLDVWRERVLDFDHMVSSEEETAHAISRSIGVPAAKMTEVFADGQVQIVELEVDPAKSPQDELPAGVSVTDAALKAAGKTAARRRRIVGLPLREADLPAESRVAGIIRGERQILPRGNETIQPGDRIVVIGSPQSAREWSGLMARGARKVKDVVIFGAGRAGSAAARLLLRQGISVRLIEPDRARAEEASLRFPEARVLFATGFDPDFLERERIGETDAAVFTMKEDGKNLYAATLARLQGAPFTIAVAHEHISADVFERAGIDVAIDPRSLTAEEIVRFAHDPRTQQVAMLEQDRYEVLDITVRAESKLVGKPFRELPMTGSVIGAIVRDGTALFPHGEDQLEPGDRVIIFTESSRVADVERAL